MFEVGYLFYATQTSTARGLGGNLGSKILKYSRASFLDTVFRVLSTLEHLTRNLRWLTGLVSSHPKWRLHLLALALRSGTATSVAMLWTARDVRV